MNVNKVTLVGRVGQSPTVRETAKGKVCTLTLATNSGYGDKETTDWHKITFFDKIARTVEEHVAKGQELYIEGRIKYSKWTDKEGIEKWSTEIIAQHMQMGARAGQDKSVSSTGDEDLESPPF